MSKSNKYYSDIQETKISEYLGWDKVSGSGSRPTHPGDICSHKWLGECKTHTKESDNVIFKFSDWDKIFEEAISQFKNPVLFCDNGSQNLECTFCLIDLHNMVVTDQDIEDVTNQSSYSFKLEDYSSFRFLMRNDTILGVFRIDQFLELIELLC